MIYNKNFNSNNLVEYSKKSKILDKEEEYRLIDEWKNNQNKKALNKIISSYLRLIVSIARKHRRYGISLEDLINEGILGMMHAIEKFDLNMDFRLSTYGSWWIKASIQDYILKNWSIVKTGSSAGQKSLFFNLQKLKKQINNQSINFLGDQELEMIATMLNVNKKDVQNMESRLTGGDQYLNQTIDENNNELISLFTDEDNNPEKIVENNFDNRIKKQWLKLAMNQLKDREKIIINARKLEEKAKTLEDLGKEFGISKERVRQIEDKALNKLQKNILKISKQTKDFFVN
tara:strand:+ start:6271 stop:7137 length:867 start_codon:yes stop_codon:yes gene_type:complete